MTEQNFDAEYDLVVVGGGAAGKSAAYTAAQAGLSVCILEKMPTMLEGSCVYAEGTAAFESSEQKARKFPIDPATGEPKKFPTKQDAFERYMNYSHFRANPQVARTMADNAYETIDIYKSLGIQYTDVTIYAYNQELELYSFHRPEGLGLHCQETLLKAVQDAGVDIFTSTPAKNVIMDDGRVIGVVAEDADGNTMRVGGKAVLLSAGGFGNNPDLVEKYSWFSRTAHAMGMAVPTQNTGDGLGMALEAGGDTENIGAVMIIAVNRGKTLTSHTSGAGSQPVLWINKTGRRFANEDVAMSFADCGNTMAKQPDATVYAIIDSDTVTHLMEEGSDIGLGDFIVYHQKLTGLQTELDQDVADGIAWTGNTAEELAAAIGLDPEVVAATIARYNEACANGYDPEFFKPAASLRPVTKAPFYAINMTGSVLVSCGGIRVNGSLQVVNSDYEPIPGLYAAGMEASGLYGDTYNLDVPGTANGFAHTSGRVAARHVIATLQSAVTV
jgi:fumarate reductase flavoprotein subunit